MDREVPAPLPDDMLIKIGFDIEFELRNPTPMVLMLFVHPSRQADLRSPEELRVTPDTSVSYYSDLFGNRCARLLAPEGNVRLQIESLIEDSGEPDPQSPDAVQHQIESLPDETLAFLMPSRYCEVDKLTDTAWKLFGQTPPGWARVKAICDWVNQHITFGYHFANSSKSAFDVYTDGRGVCRDFSHLALTFCRCMNIPARYVTGYMGDIGVPLVLPMDFSGWFEVYLGDRWHTFDARHNVPRIGRIVMATGRDAADVALTTNFGSATLKKFFVISDEVTA
ncbi:MAG TPA: transglutaminase family protein [Chthoniobacterales bacterium]|jgi:transglutaminase-like putative cysteine protease